MKIPSLKTRCNATSTSKHKKPKARHLKKKLTFQQQQKRKITTTASIHNANINNNTTVPTIHQRKLYIASTDLFSTTTTSTSTMTLNFKSKRFFSNNNNAARFAPINPEQSQHLTKQIEQQTGVDLNKFEKLLQDDPKAANRKNDPLGVLDDSDDFSEELAAEMTEAEDPIEYTKNFEKDDVKPEFFNPNTQPLEFTIAHLLQAEIEGVAVFPVYLRRHTFDKIVNTLNKVQQQLPPGMQLDEQQVMTVIYDVFINFAPELARTHEHALNMLFPMAPRIGDIVELPNIVGKCVVAKREYVDNRWNDDPDLDITDKERMMVIQYDCLHPSLRGKSLRSSHPFDMQVYKLTVQQDEKGLERLMHERGIIDMYTGRILNPDDRQIKKLQQDLHFDPKLLKGPGAKILINERAAITAAQNNGFDPNSLRLPGHANNNNIKQIGNNNGIQNPLLLGENDNGIQNNKQQQQTQMVESFFNSERPQDIEDEEVKHKFILDRNEVMVRPGFNTNPEADNNQIMGGVEFNDQFDKDGRKLLFDQSTLLEEHHQRTTIPNFKITPQEESIRKYAMSQSNNLYDVLQIYREQKSITNNNNTTSGGGLNKIQKDYLRPKVLTGEAAMIMYKSLMRELSSGNTTDRLKNMSDQDRKKEQIKMELLAHQAQQQQQQQQQNTSSSTTTASQMPSLDTLGVSGAKMTTKGASYGPDDSLAAVLAADNAKQKKLEQEQKQREIEAYQNQFGSMNNNNKTSIGGGTGSTHNVDAIPNQMLSIKEKRELDKKLNTNMKSVDVAQRLIDNSTYMKKYRKMQLEKRQALLNYYNTQDGQTKTGYEIHQEQENLKKKQDEDFQRAQDEYIAKVEELKQTRGVNHDIAQVMAEEYYTKLQIQQEKEAEEDFLKQMQIEGVEAYKYLPEKYKQKYNHIIVTKGPGCGLPDPLRIDRGEDLFDIYPNANLTLMDFLSDQWTAMVEEKQNLLNKQKSITLQYQDVKARKRQKLNELCLLSPQHNTQNPEVINLLNEKKKKVLSDEEQEEERLRQEWLQLGEELKQANGNNNEQDGNNVGNDDNLELEDLDALVPDYDDDNENNNNQTQIINQVNKKLNDKFQLPYDVELTRYRLLATIAAAGDHAFTAEYIQDIFERVMKSTNYDGMKEMIDEETTMQINFDKKQQNQNEMDNVDIEVIKQRKFDDIKHMAFSDDDEEEQNDNNNKNKTNDEISQKLNQQALIAKKNMILDDSDDFSNDDDDGSVDADFDALEADIEATLQKYSTPSQTSTSKQQQSQSTNQQQQRQIQNNNNNNNNNNNTTINGIPIIDELEDRESKGVKITKDGMIKRGGKLYTAEEYATLIFGKKPTPIEESPLIPQKMRDMIKSHYQHRRRLQAEKERQKAREQFLMEREASMIVDNDDDNGYNNNIPESACPRDQMSEYQQQHLLRQQSMQQHARVMQGNNNTQQQRYPPGFTINPYDDITMMEQDPQKQKALYEIQKRQDLMKRREKVNKQMAAGNNADLIKTTPLRAEVQPQYYNTSQQQQQQQQGRTGGGMGRR